MVIQICLCKLGVGMMLNIGINMNVFWGMACMVLAIKTPSFLREFLVPAGGSGSGVINNVYHSVRLVGMVRYGKVNGVSLKGWNGLKLDDISIAIISLIRAGAVFRFVYCMVRLQGAEEEQAQYRKRAKNTVLFYIVAESIWQIKDIVMYYYG